MKLAPLQKKITFTLIIDSQEMRVDFRPRYFADYGHFKFRSPYDPPHRILLSQTGYRSHFSPMHEIEEAPSVEEYALVLALALLQRQSIPDNDEDSDEEETEGQ